MLQKINLKEQVNALDKLFEYKRVGTLNNHMLNVLQAENRTLEFHVHENSDEMFYCIEGEIDIEFEENLSWRIITTNHVRNWNFVMSL